MVYFTAGIASPTAIEEYFKYLSQLDRERIEELLITRVPEFQLPRQGRFEDQLRLLAAQLADPQNLAGALLALSRRQLAILRHLWRNAANVAASGIEGYFAAVLDRDTLEEELSFFKDLALVLPADGGRVTVPEAVRSALLGRVGPAHPAGALLRSLKRETIDMIVDYLEVPVGGAAQPKKVAALTAMLSDEDRVRGLIQGLSEDERRTLELAARNGGQIDIWTLSQQLPKAVAKAPYGGYLLSLQQAGKLPKDPAPSLTLQIKALLFPYPPDWASTLVIPDEVLAAMRPLPALDPADFRQPELAQPPATAQPAGIQPAPVLDLVECLTYVRDEHPSLTQKMLVAKPDSKRLSRRLSFQDPSYADLLFTLASVLGVVDGRHTAMKVSRETERWLQRTESEQRTDLFNAWSMLLNWHDEEEEPYPRGNPFGDPVSQRVMTISMMSEMPPEGATLSSLAARLQFQIPGYFEQGILNPTYGLHLSRPEAWVNGVLRVLGWLGLAEPLLLPGTPGSPAEVAGARLTTFGRALLQADETARAAVQVPRTDRVIVQPTLDILAPPNIEPLTLYRLRAVTDPGGAGGMRTLSLTPGSVRRALDRGTTPAQLRALLARHSDPQPLPNTVEALLADVAAKHGRVRVGSAGFYLTVDEPHLLAELQADKHTADLVKRVIAPTVALVDAPSLDKILDKLRSAGHMPVVDTDKPRTKEAPSLQIIPRSRPAKAAQPAKPEPRPGERASDVDGILAVLRQAEKVQRPVEIEYAGRVKGRETISKRFLDVHEVFDDGVFGYDHLQDREREFKLSRIHWARLASDMEVAERF